METEMTEYDNNNRGVLFMNKNKSTDKHPDYRGEAEVNGKKMEMSAWIKNSKTGETFMSLQFKEPFKKTEEKGGWGKKPTHQVDLADDDVPF
jgi:uncharacterized protein (DUF736 family)